MPSRGMIGNWIRPLLDSQYKQQSYLSILLRGKTVDKPTIKVQVLLTYIIRK